MFLYIYCVFFFSSRRRHTRSDRDWSSDVCSSDLRSARGGCGCAGARDAGRAERQRTRLVSGTRGLVRDTQRGRQRAGGSVRSEERRVGKEWRGRGGRCEYKEKEVRDVT